MSRTVKLISDGTPMGTRLVDALTGEDLQLPMSAITWRIEADMVGQATVTVELAQANVEGVLGEPVEETGDGADR